MSVQLAGIKSQNTFNLLQVFNSLYEQFPMRLYNSNNSEKMATGEESKPRDCFACRAVGAVGLVGIGGYLGMNAAKSKTTAGKYFISFLSFGFICLGVARYKQTFPFNKNDDFKS